MNNNNDKKEQNGPNKSGPQHHGRKTVTVILIALIVAIILNLLTSAFGGAVAKEISYTEFEQMIAKGEVESVLFQKDRILIAPKTEEDEEKTKKPALLMPGYTFLQAQQEPDLYFTGVIPNLPLTQLKAQLDAAGIEYESAVQEEPGLLMTIVSWLLPVAAMYLLFTLLMNGMSKKMGGGGGGLGGIGKNKAKVYMEKQTGVTFADVAGQDEAKESLVEIIDFLHNPQKYAEIGAKLPKGALLVGSPGTGKTLLAKAVAGEANVPFFSISGSDFVEMFVGVGASRVRDLFNEASKVAPSIIFIDEIDAIGRTRDSKFGGNDEREQTLNQLLAEIDGFDSSKGVVILAATNRPEILDKALLRAGRFDRRIIVDRPNLAGRYQTLRVHTKNIKLADDVDLNKIAQATAGAVGADLASLVNEAALRAVRKGRKTVNQEDLLTSFEFVIAGTEKKGTILTDMEKRVVAYHEVGHALVAALEKHAQPVSKITIVPHTSGALGYTMQMPEEEKYLSTKEELITELKTLLGGRAAEQTVFGIQTTGAANDIDRATELARKMITQYGMSERFGLMALSTVSNPYLDGSTMMNCADETAAQADGEIKELLESCYADAKRILTEKRALLDEIALYLLEKETIVGDELMAFIRADEKKSEPEAVEETPSEQEPTE
ncbi:MAG: ATP-dependent zinc metalloprotease FtsH [Oscillospiraceae bacterium]|nr:ATP-dependent zinc metalloprotease FtsH [Oscillospiraceae bacterium]MBR2897374.1 ATP-dependent zinc metalloprotease FtsH [Oscillospiraceae bacterium]MBR2977939.1 ATP-dependent zinc metalloprotease FtsH [Oscillospiraceae bacterium]